jgi:hypothetical protein
MVLLVQSVVSNGATWGMAKVLPGVTTVVFDELAAPTHCMLEDDSFEFEPK